MFNVRWLRSYGIFFHFIFAILSSKMSNVFDKSLKIADVLAENNVRNQALQSAARGLIKVG